ncbi:DDE-type integrase/transposase/recombinase [Rhodohalobacter halophilus]|uniref:DDE-type integrase/transposase/recombinase n=1 Tax=Rhodohalobacter halophilus TaxID=1812810 RepID=UPI00083F779C|nr:DDE-type integrase/transposase/recombinase [Rhodohalobacter halophilus]
MKQMLDWQGITRQGAHQGIARLRKAQRDLLETAELAAQVRSKHPQMGCRDIYYAVREQMPRGRDWTEQLLLNCGYRVKTPPRSFTVAGQGVKPNLIEGKSITGANQVWQTDITYVWSGGRWYYVSFVIDGFTRQILASHCSRDLSSASQIRCLNKAFVSQNRQELRKLIIHTDRGVQYTSEEYKNYLSCRDLRHSMAHYAWQNAYCERVNRTIKSNYLTYYTTDNYRSLCQGVAKAVRLYNRSKPHRGLPSRLSPDQFVKELNQGSYPDYRVNIWSKLTSTKMVHVN